MSDGRNIRWWQTKRWADFTKTILSWLPSSIASRPRYRLRA